MKRTNPLVLAVLAGATLSPPAIAVAQAGRPIAQASHVAKVSLRQTSLGKVLVDSSGFTLFRFTKDSRNHDACAAVKGCPSTWPALTTSGKPLAGSGVKSSLLSTIKLPNGARQVTYDGHPLYRYAAASEAGETYYVGVQNFGGTWDAVSASGGLVK